MKQEGRGDNAIKGKETLNKSVSSLTSIGAALIYYKNFAVLQVGKSAVCIMNNERNLPIGTILRRSS